VTLAAAFLPLGTAFALAVAATAAHRRLGPAVAARMLAVAVAAIVAAALPSMWILALGYLAHTSVLGEGFAWCKEALGLHDRVPWQVGVPALVFSFAGIVGVARVIAMQRRLRRLSGGPLEVADCDVAFAYTLPGRAGQIVVSTGLLELLDDDEQAVVLAHERAHGEHRHDRFLLLARLAETVLPPLRPLTRRLHFSLERWADEAAVAATGGDRRFVARTLAKTALAGAAPAGALSFMSLGVPARVAALMAPAPSRHNPALLGALWTGVVVAILISLWQLHHLASLLSMICPG
jgi:hypothetical protein